MGQGGAGAGGGAPASATGGARPALSRALAAAAAVLVAPSLLLANGAYHPLALAAVTLAIVAALGALLFARSRVDALAPGVGRRWALAILWVGVATSLALDALVLPGIYVDPSRLGAFRPLLGALAALVATHAWKIPPRLARLRFAAELAVFALFAALVLRASPAPMIDVWFMEKLGATALLDGANPYSVHYPNIYGPGTRLLADALLSPDRRHVIANPYTPLTLLLVTPAVALASDPRWTMVAAVLFAAWAVRRLGRGSEEASLAAIFLLVQPRGLFVLEQSWTEPLVLALLLGAALAVSRLRARPSQTGPSGGAVATRDLALVALAGGGALAIKQYTPLLLVPLAFAIPPGARLRSAALAAAAAVAVAVPFLAWDPQGFLRGIVLFQIEQPFRADALSWAAALFRLTGTKAPAWIAFAAAVAAVVFAARGGVTVARALLGAAVAWLAFIVLSKQAFCNYYWLAVGLLCAAVAAREGAGGGGAIEDA
jgi:hypothetical protein